MKRSRAVTVIFLLAGLAVVVVLWNDREPSYGGKPLDEWLEELDTKSARDADTAAANAIRAMEKDALPYLVAHLQKGQSFWNNMIESGWLPDRIRPRENHQIKASLGLACLREKAIPDLVKLLDTERAPMAAITLGRMCPVGALALCDGLTNTNTATRTWCLRTLGAVNQWSAEPGYADRVDATATIVVPRIAETLKDRDPGVASEARTTLWRFSTNATVNATTRNFATPRLQP